MSDHFDEVDRPGIEHVIRRIVREELEGVWTHCPGEITEYDPATKRATVQVKGRLKYRDPQTGEMVEEEIAPITNVPVHFPGGGLGEFVWDIEPPESCWLKFSKLDLDEWLSTGDGGPASEAPPFDLSNAVAEVGLRHFGAPGDPVPTKTIRLGAKDGPQIVFDMANLVLRIASINELVLQALRIRIIGEDVYIGDRLVDQLNTGDIS